MKIVAENNQLLKSVADPTKLSKGKGEAVDQRKLKLRKATEEFESFFTLQMLQSMRKTIPKSELTNGGLGQEVYTSIFDEELAKTMAGQSQGSLSDILYNSLVKSVEAESVQRPETMPTEIPDRVRNYQPVQSLSLQSGTKSTQDQPDEVKAVELPIQTTSLQPISSDPVLEKYGKIIDHASRRYNLPPRLVYSVIMAESSGRADVVSPKGARGLMQLTDSTATDLGVTDSLNPTQNIMGGAKYLSQLLERYDGDLKLSLAAYNAGPGNVSKYNGVPPFPETENYVEKVLGELHSRR